ncbi:mucin-17-like [Marmota monax]|uniref:mucin-17-like n=1 Tax=Marmota monax TaxID=9995 RepID=UPI001EAFC4C4|nr:mucin-17-like [Marmota monax]
MTFCLSVTCMNGGKWTGVACDCPPGFTGDRCQFLTNVCQNGGLWDGLKCQCPSLYYGPLCENVVESIEIEPPPQTVTAQMELTVTVTSEPYSDKLQDRSSQEFKKFNDTFTEQMNTIYSGIPEYEGVNITGLRQGSVVVEHDIILKTKFTPEYKEIFKKATEEVKEKIENATRELISNNDTCTALLCFNSTATKVQNITVTQYDPEEECRKKAGEELAPYFTVEYKDQKPYCITPCMAGFNASWDCHYGKCQLQRSGPQCYCLITETHWYSGETCEWGIQKSLVYGLAGAGGAVVLLVIVVLLVFTLRSRREVKRQKATVSQLYQWQEDDGGSVPGTLRNIGFDICEEREDYIHLDAIYSNFQPSLNHIDPTKKVQIQRPQVVMTAL